MSKTHKTNIAIIGAGIGGLTTALYLHHLGIKAKIFEAVNEIKELGVGINLLPRATDIYRELNILNKIEANGVSISEIDYFNKYGQNIYNEPRGMAAGYRIPQIAISRGVLQGILVRAVKERLGNDSILTNHRLVDLKEEADGINCYFQDQPEKNPISSYKADVVIAADGFRSTVRSIFYPNEKNADWLGVLMWRGTTVGEPFLSGSSMVFVGDFNKRMVIYPIQKLSKNEVLINWVAEVRRPDVTPMPAETSWNKQVQADEFMKEYQGWRFNWLDIEQLISQANQIFTYPMMDKNPVQQWCFGNIALLGDAAHPMYPSGSNAGSQAIIDAKEIALELKNNEDTTQALTLYETNRIDKVNQLVLANREFSAEKILQVVDERAPEGFSNIHDIIKDTEIQILLERYKKIAGFSLDDFKS